MGKHKLTLKTSCWLIYTMIIITLCLLKINHKVSSNEEIILSLIGLVVLLIPGIVWLIQGWISDYQHRVK